MKRQDMGTRRATGNESLADYAELVKGVAARVSAFQRELQSVLPISATEDPNYYHAYPFLFRDEFSAVSDAQATTLAVAGVFYLNHLCLLDDVVDSQGAWEPHKLFLSALLHEEAVVQLARLFPAGSTFWAQLSAYHREFAAAMLREQAEHTGKLSPFSAEEIFQIAKGKAALSKMTTTALALLAGRPETIADLSGSQDCFNAARQLYDDVKDWKEDYQNGRYSSLLTAALLEMTAGEARDPQAVVDVDALSAQLHGEGHIERALAQAAAWCDDALNYVAHYHVGGWTRLVGSLRAQVVRLRDDLATIRKRGAGPIPLQGHETEPVGLKAETV